MIKILNYRNNCELNYSLVVIFGQIKLECSKLDSIDRRDQLVKCKYRKVDRKCLITNHGRFKFIVLIRPGFNVLEFTFAKHTTKLNLLYRQVSRVRWIKLYYVVCASTKDESTNRVLFDDGKFQSSRNDNPNTIENAKKRIGLALLMLQTFLASILPNRSTFDLDLDDDDMRPKVELFLSEFSLDEFKQMSQETIWRNIAVELLKANSSHSNLKYVAFLSFSRYRYDEKLIEDPNRISYDELIKMTECFIALGGGSLACLSTCSLFCWPESLEEIESKFNDTTTIDPKLELNDCGNSLSTFGQVYSSSFGSVLHELCHIFDLGEVDRLHLRWQKAKLIKRESSNFLQIGHETYGIMDRQFELIRNYFLNTTNEDALIRWFNRSSFLLLSNHKFLNKTLKLRDDNWSGTETICLAIDESDDCSRRCNENFAFDRTKSTLTSKNGIILVEYRNSKNSCTLDYTEFNLAKKVLNLSTIEYFKKYKNRQDTLIVVLDRLGNLFKFN